MRQIISSGSVKAIYIDKNALIERVKEVAGQAIERFPEIFEIRLFGSFASGDYSSLSDVDILVVLRDDIDISDPIEITRPYFAFFSGQLNIAIDVIVSRKNEINKLGNIIAKSKLIAFKPAF